MGPCLSEFRFVMESDNYKRFDKIGFADFRRMAQDDSLSRYEKVGFPNSYRQGKEQFIFEDIIRKLPTLNSRGKTVVDIGPGCSELAFMIADLCRRNDHTLILIDSDEMLAHLPDETFIRKIAGYYPRCEEMISEYRGRVDACLAYSVLHYVFTEGNVWDFLDTSLELLAHEGALLIGDIPNVSMRKRFFSSPAGIEFHHQFMGTQADPDVTFNQVERDRIDDAVVMSLLARARSAGYDAYVMPQPADLPMANRREDILISRP